MTIDNTVLGTEMDPAWGNAVGTKLNGLPGKIQTGSSAYTVPDGSGEFTMTFDEAFDTTPTVVAQAYRPGTALYFPVTIDTRSTTSFKVTIHVGSSTNNPSLNTVYDVRIDYIAVEGSGVVHPESLADGDDLESSWANNVANQLNELPTFVQYGTTASAIPGTNGLDTITFPEAFGAVPTVVATMQRIGTVFHFLPTLVGLTTTSFQVRSTEGAGGASQENNTTLAVQINWVAIGVRP